MRKLFFGLLLLSSTVIAAPGAGLTGTAHDFTDDSSQPVGLCTFCHTPHKALLTKLLWNHTLSTNTFNWDVATTTGGTTFVTIDGDTYQGASAKCLSCHDGSVAVGDIAWFNAGDPGSLYNLQITPGSTFSIGSGGNMAGNHPVAHPYPLNNAKSYYNRVTSGDSMYFDEWVADPTQANSKTIRIFNDDGTGQISAGSVPGKSGIECSSCHDPHNKKAIDKFFLRGMLTGNTTDYICLKCHVK